MVSEEAISSGDLVGPALQGSGNWGSSSSHYLGILGRTPNRDP